MKINILIVLFLYVTGAFSQITSEEILLKNDSIQSSMSRKGNCWDNAVAESFFATIKKELIHRNKFATRREAVAAIFEYIEVFYNRVRKHSQLGYTSPAQFRRHNQSAAAAA